MDELKKIKDEVLACKKCPLYKTRTYPVIGQGNHRARIIFIGEAPGLSEDKTGHPFCGEAGKVLDELLESTGIKREEIYISNILKCRPLGNRDPKTEEIKACTSYLERQIKIIKPEIICTLGNYSTAYILEKYGLKDKIQGISKIHGKIFSPPKAEDDIKIIPLYHPAVVAYNANMKETLKKDFKVLEKFK
jgi:DNA polymerase